MALDPLIQLLVYLLVGGLVIYVIYWILGLLPFPQPIKQIILALFGIAILLWLLRTLGII